MTPQLQQAIRLLQLSSLELQAEIQQALEENPLLDREEAPAREESLSDLASEADGSDAVDGSEDEGDISNLAAEEGWDQRFETPAAPGTGTAKKEPPSDRSADIPDDGDGLCEHLLWQLNLATLSPIDNAIGTAIIYGLDEAGYLADGVEDILASVGEQHEIELDEVEAVRHRIQRFDPLGVASVSLAECLKVQLEALEPDTPFIKEAELIICDHLDKLAKQDMPGLKRALGLGDEDLKAAVAVIRDLNPRPGAGISSARTEYIAPDVYVRRIKGKWKVSLNPENEARLRINSVYAGMIKGANERDASYLRSQLQEARWFMKSLETRNETLLKVARCIVKHQQGFFEHGPVAMKPLVLREVADSIDMHESTVSRVTNRKYMHSPRGIFEFKYFFSSHVSTSDGGEASATAIQAMIKKLIDEEPPQKPLSDSKLTTILNEQGIDVARRTVAKYREAMQIASSTRRKRLI